MNTSLQCLGLCGNRSVLEQYAATATDTERQVSRQNLGIVAVPGSIDCQGEQVEPHQGASFCGARVTRTILHLAVDPGPEFYDKVQDPRSIEGFTLIRTLEGEDLFDAFNAYYS